MKLKSIRALHKTLSSWRVGDGKKIRIWQDHWLPRKHPPYVSSYPLVLKAQQWMSL